MDFAQFILQHDGEDVARLALSRERYATQVEDFNLALHTLEARPRLRTKLPEWYAIPSLVYPSRLSAEQCSSSETARYKASVALTAIAGACSSKTVALRPLPPAEPAGPSLLCSRGWPQVFDEHAPAIADLTGGLGVDSWAFSQVAEKVLYNEMQPELAAAAEHNFRELGVRNIRVQNRELLPGNLAEILGDFRPELIFLDPARRAADGRKVFRLQDCRPDILTLLPELLESSAHVLLKLSPMADIDLICKQLGCVKAVHVVAAEKECKELLLLLERGFAGTPSVILYESGATLPADGDVPAVYATEISPGQWLFEPGKAILKAGAFSLPCRYGLQKLSRHTHLYLAAEPEENLRPFGKWLRIIEKHPFDKRSFRTLGKRWPQAEVTARDLPVSSEELRSRLGCPSGGTVHIYGVRTLAGPELIVTENVP